MKFLSRFAASILLLVFGLNAVAADTFVVRDMRVEGLQRIADGTVYNYLPVNIGDELGTRRIAEAIRALYETGLFSDVQMGRDGDTLVIAVTERPTIRKISVTGNKQVKEEELLSGLRDAGLAEGREFDRSVLEKVEQELNRLYFGNGRYGVKIDTNVQELANNAVDVNIVIKEGKVARIRDINIVGNQLFEDKRLLREFKSSTGNWLSFYRKDDQYSREKLSGDLQSLSSFYMDRGYAGFEVKSTQVAISPDKKDIFLTINISEGDIYKVSDVKLAGEMVIPEASIRRLIRLQPDSTFSRRQITESIDLINLRLGIDGYAFSEVEPIPEFDEEARTVAVTFFVNPGQRAYVRRINFNGIESTRDDVFRREMRVFEGSWMSSNAVDRSKTRIQRLPFVEDVQVETTKVPGEPDLVDIDFDIKLRQSGTLQGGVGFSDQQGLILNGGFTEANFLGTGDRLALSLNTGRFASFYNISHTNPYFTEDGISRTLSLNYRKTDQLVSNASQFTSNELGLVLQFGLPLTEYSALSLGTALRDTELLASNFSPEEYYNWVRDNGKTFFRKSPFRDTQGNERLLPGSTFKTYELLLGFARDTRNRTIFADRGSRHSISVEYALPGSDVEYYVARYSGGMLFPMFGNFTLSMRGNIAYGDGIGDTRYLPPNKNMFAGGSQSVRGFRNNRLSPLDSFGNPYGGNAMLTGQVELLFPTPERLQGTARFGLFADFGNAFYTGDRGLFQVRDDNGVPTGQEPVFNPEFWDFSLDEIRYSVGLTATWLAPIGALSFSYGVPLNAVENDPTRPDDDTERFQFTINSPF